MKKIKSLILGLLTSVLLTTSVSADTILNITNFTPERPGVQFVEGTQGFSYPSFNNFIGNPNIAAGGRQGDERKFLVGKICEGGETGCPGQLFYNTPPTAVEEGDIVRFEVYFHNNGDDPYDGDSITSPDAQNVYIGIDLKNIQDPNFPQILRPRGFIHADNNEYRLNIKDSTTVIKDGLGQPIRLATDDMQVLLSEYNLELKPVKDSAFLTVLKGPNDYYDDYINGPTNITFDTESPDSISVNVDEIYLNNEMMIKFDKLPGCFRYSGFAQFDAIVTKKPTDQNICKELIANKLQVVPKDVVVDLTKQNLDEEMYQLSINSIKFEKDPLPTNAQIKWKSQDPNGIFWLANAQGIYQPTGGNERTTNPEQFVLYTGNGPVTAEVVPTEYASNACKYTFEMPVAPICDDIIVNYNSPIVEGKLSQFEAKPLDSDGKDFNGLITYSVEPGHGTFYVIKPTNLTLNNSNYIENFDTMAAIERPSNGLFCSGLEPITFNAGSSVNRVIQTLPENNLNKLKTNINLGNVGNFTKTSLFDFKFNPTDPTNYTRPAFEIPNAKDLSISTTIEPPKQFAPGESVTVNPGQTVWFYAEQPGKNVIRVQTNCTDSSDCFKTFDIEPAPVEECLATNFTAIIAGTKNSVQCLANEAYTFRTEFYYDTAKQNKISASLIEVLWKSTDKNGEFFDPVKYTQSVIQGETPIGSKGSFAGGNVVRYQGGGEVTSTLYTLNGKIYAGPVCKEIIEPCENGCEELGLISIPQSPLEVGETANLFINSTDKFGKSLPAGTKLNWSTNTGGTLSTELGTTSDSNGNLSTMLQETPLIFSNSKTEGTVKVGISPTDDFYSPICIDEITVESPLICEDLNIVINPNGAFEPNNFYTLTGSAQYSKTYNGKVIYTIDSDNGALIKKQSGVNQSIILNLLNFAKDDSNGITQQEMLLISTELNALTSKEIVSSNIIVADGEQVIVVVYSNAKKSTDTFLSIRADGFINPECATIYPLELPEIPVCDDLTITQPNRPWKYIDYKNDAFKEQIFSVNISPSSQKNKFNYAWEITQGEGQFATGKKIENDLFITNQGATTNLLENFNENTEITVWATLDNEKGNPLFKNGKQICVDSIKIVNEEEPEITKVVFKRGESEDADDLINIGDSSVDEFLTYQIAFDTGSLGGDVQIREEEFLIGSIDGNQGGELDFVGMRINVDEGADKYTILKTDKYVDDNDIDNNYDELGDNPDDYYDEYDCDKGDSTDTVCIETDEIDDNFDQIIEDFKDGEFIRFKNLKANSTIYINVQVKNNSVIDEESCKKIEVEDGCGELFYNRASFKMDIDDNNQPEYTGSDDAEVIVICPFILTRTAGDVFFHDVVDTGVDVAKCSEVKSTPAPPITPEPPPIRRTPQTGADISQLPLALELPSHDICRYSNLEGNIEGYNDVLKNFSSTICELRAEVAETWTEANINAAINANIERISRFEGNLNNVDKITSIANLTTISNANSGVFVKTNGDLEINLFEDFQGIENIPAAQTYIVKNGDLIISSDINYASTNYFAPNSIPSVAFIVIDGNIKIKNEVERIDGVLMAVDLDNSGDDGKVTNLDGKTTTNQHRLVINGSLIGDVYELFNTRRAVGDPTKDEGSVTIRYDERILLNAPPGLKELINISQSIIPQ